MTAAYSPPDPFEIAVEHIAWCIRQKWTAIEVFQSVGRYKDNPTWNDALWIVASLQTEMVANCSAVRDGRFTASIHTACEARARRQTAMPPPFKRGPLPDGRALHA